MREDWLETFLGGQEEKITPRQEQIIRAAVEVFGEKGFANASTNEIAKRAGVAEGTIFRYYKTKKDLLVHIVAPMLLKFVAPIAFSSFVKEVFNKSFGTVDELLATIIDNRFEFAKNHVPILRILVREIPFDPQLRGQLAELFTEEVLTKFQARIEQFQEKGLLVEAPSLSVMRFVVTAVVGFLLTRFIFLDELLWDDEEEKKWLLQFILHGVAPK